MNKNDVRLVIFIFIMAISLILVTKIFDSNDPKTALIYYENELIKKIDLSIDKSNEYVIKGFNGDVIVKSKKNMIKVSDEISPLNICSKQGWISSSYEVIVCLPNKILIKIESNQNEFDAVVR